MAPANGPYTSGTTISSVAINARFADEEVELGDSLSRSGKGGMLSSLRTPDGTVAAPAVSFTSEPGSGLYKAGTGDVRVAVGGVDAAKLAAGGFVDGVTLVSGQTRVLVTLTGGFLRLQGNLNATNLAADVVTDTSVVRTAGYLFAAQNNGTDKLHVDYQGLLSLASQAAALQPAGIWTAITPGANWTAQSGPAFFKDALGIVRLRGGVIAGAAAANPIATLPVGFRPSVTRYFAISDSSTGAAVGFVASDGTINMNTAITNGHIYYFDTIAFVAEA